MRSFAIVAALAATQAVASNIFRKCPLPEVQQDFDVEAYTGLWYEQRRDTADLFESSTGICVTAQYFLNDNGTLRVLNNEYDDKKSKWGGGEGVATVVDPTKNEGYLTVKFNVFAPAGDYKVVETDYENYTVIYTCFGLASANIEYAWIMTRDANPTKEVMDKAYAAIATKIPKYDSSIKNFPATPQGDGALKSGEACPYDSQPNAAMEAQSFFASLLQ